MTNQPDAMPTTGLIPHLTIAGERCREAVAFYEAAFGARQARPLVEAEGSGRVMHAHLLINGGALMLNDDFPEHRGRAAPTTGPVVMHLRVDDADRWFDRAIEAGARVDMPLADMFWGDRYGQLTDPFGQVWAVAAPIAAAPAG